MVYQIPVSYTHLDVYKRQARSLADLDRAMGDAGVTLLECSALLAEGKSCEIPVLRAENGKLKVTGEVTVEEWR